MREAQCAALIALYKLFRRHTFDLPFGKLIALEIRQSWAPAPSKGFWSGIAGI